MTSSGERAAYWRVPGLALEAMGARFEHYAYPMHAHNTYSFGMLHLGEDLVREVLADAAPRTAGLPLFDTPVVDNPALARTVTRLHTAVVEHAPRLVVEECLTAAVLALSRDAATRPARLPDPQGRVDLAAMARARSLLRQRFADNIGADELARVAGCSRFTLYRGFRAAYGFAPSDYQRDLRLRRARALLAEGMAPATAAAEVGFADQAHLTRWFTRTYGVTPAAYRTALHKESVRSRSAAGRFLS